MPVEVHGGDAAAIVRSRGAVPCRNRGRHRPRGVRAPDPTAGTSPVFVATNPTHEGFPLVVSVIDESADGEWLLARFPTRPNGTTGWIRAADVTEWGLQNRIDVSLASRTLRVSRADRPGPVRGNGVGRGRAPPTPVGEFFIDIVNPLGGDPTYGWGQLSARGSRTCSRPSPAASARSPSTAGTDQRTWGGTCRMDVCA